jgi:hypothetical protein
MARPSKFVSRARLPPWEEAAEARQGEVGCRQSSFCSDPSCFRQNTYTHSHQETHALTHEDTHTQKHTRSRRTDVFLGRQRRHGADLNNHMAMARLAAGRPPKVLPPPCSNLAIDCMHR